MKDNLCKLVLDVLNGGGLNPQLVEALLVLKPKNKKPSCIKQFRPIALFNVSFKLITKIIVNRLKHFMVDIVSPNQCSFIPW